MTCLSVIADNNPEQALHIVSVNRNRSVHVAFADRQFGVEDQAADRCGILDMDRDLFAGAVAKYGFGLGTNAYRKMSLADEAAQKTFEKSDPHGSSGQTESS